MVYVQLLCIIIIITALPCMGHPVAGPPADGATWTVFASPPFQQQFLYNTPVRVFGSSFYYPETPYDTWGLAWDEPPTDRTPSIKRVTLQHDSSTGQHKRSKRFLPYMYGGMMGGYGTGMASAAASAMATNSYGSYGYPFFG